jgi:hypothetical protein
MVDTSRWLRFMLGVVFLMLSGVFAVIFTDMCAGLGCGTTGMEFVPIFPALIGIFLIIHALVVKGDGVP